MKHQQSTNPHQVAEMEIDGNDEKKNTERSSTVEKRKRKNKKRKKKRKELRQKNMKFIHDSESGGGSVKSENLTLNSKAPLKTSSNAVYKEITTTANPSNFCL